jgi:arylformamidase
MKIVDLSHTIYQGMPYYPGTEPPTLQPANTIEKDGFIETRISMHSHTGTHLDAPSHILQDGFSLDRVPIDRYFGQALKADVSSLRGRTIPAGSLLKYGDMMAHVEFVIIHTGWSRYWGKPHYFKEFPSLSEESAKWLSGFNLKGVGIDTISVDRIEAVTFPVHNILFRKNIFVIENLTNLDLIGGDIFTFSCMPLKMKDADGSPTRAFAILEASEGRGRLSTRQ